jgi:site-specific recombinase XerD
MSSSPPGGPRLLVRVRQVCRLRQLSRRTEQAYRSWIRRYVRFHRLRHPAEMGEAEVLAYLTHLTARDRVSHSTQMQALSALLFLYRDVLRRCWGGFGGWYGRPGRVGCRRC